MLQRIQSLYLITAALVSSFSLMVTWASYDVQDIIYYLAGMENSVDGISAASLMLSIIVGVALILACVFMYKNRPQQVKFIRIIWIQQALVIGMFSLTHYRNIEDLRSMGDELSISYGMGLVFPLITTVLLWLSLKAIKKDEELVKSVDRLR